MSGLIGLAIIGIWLIVLVPMWLNRHDADDASRSVDSFSTAMRVLSRRSPSRSDRRYVVMPRRDYVGVTVDNNPGATTSARRFRWTRRVAPPVGSGARARLMARRRRVTAVVLALLVVLLVTSVFGVTSWWYELAVALTAAGYLIHLRNEAIRAQELLRRRRARAARAVASARHGGPAPAYRQPVAQPARDDDEVLPAAAVSAAGTENGTRWEPVPVPLPTYVSKPVVQRPAATASPRADVDATGTIDLTRPGAWSDSHEPEIDHRHLLDDTGSARIASSAGAPPSPYLPASDDDDELDLILERRRAVGD
ncbi:MAG TPA: hypothetical protein VF218_16495 [Acidothermaceae bacterium]